MENWPKEKLISEINKLTKDTKYLQTKLSGTYVENLDYSRFMNGIFLDIVSAFKRLSKEKKALESGLKAFQNVYKPGIDGSDTSQKQEGSDSSSTQEDERNFQQELNALMTSFQALTAEKNHMEATYQADKKKLLQEKDRVCPF